MDVSPAPERWGASPAGRTGSPLPRTHGAPSAGRGGERPGSPHALLRKAFERAFNRPAPPQVRIDDNWDDLLRGPAATVRRASPHRADIVARDRDADSKYSGNSPLRRTAHAPLATSPLRSRPLASTTPVGRGGLWAGSPTASATAAKPAWMVRDTPPARPTIHFVGPSSMGAVVVDSSGLTVSNEQGFSTFIAADAVTEVELQGDDQLTVHGASKNVTLQVGAAIRGNLVEALRTCSAKADKSATPCPVKEAPPRDASPPPAAATARSITPVWHSAFEGRETDDAQHASQSPATVATTHPAMAPPAPLTPSTRAASPPTHDACETAEATAPGKHVRACAGGKYPTACGYLLSQFGNAPSVWLCPLLEQLSHSVGSEERHDMLLELRAFLEDHGQRVPSSVPARPAPVAWASFATPYHTADSNVRSSSPQRPRFDATPVSRVEQPPPVHSVQPTRLPVNLPPPPAAVQGSPKSPPSAAHWQQPSPTASKQPPPALHAGGHPQSVETPTVGHTLPTHMQPQPPMQSNQLVHSRPGVRTSLALPPGTVHLLPVASELNTPVETPLGHNPAPPASTPHDRPAPSPVGASAPMSQVVPLPPVPPSVKDCQYLTPPPNQVSVTFVCMPQGLQMTLMPSGVVKGPINQLLYDGLGSFWLPEFDDSIALPAEGSRLTVLAYLRDMCASSGVAHNIPAEFEGKATTVTLVRTSHTAPWGILFVESGAKKDAKTRTLVLGSPENNTGTPADAVHLEKLQGWTVTHVDGSPVATVAEATAVIKDASQSLTATIRATRPACVVCNRDDRDGEVRKSGFKCKECVGKKGKK